MATTLYPLKLRPMLYPKVWGGDRLSRFGKAVKPGDRIGESWELADLDQTSASGAGGGAARSIIDNGPLAGRTLGEAMRLFGSKDMLGHAVAREGNEASGGAESQFPLLVKFLDARENLSVQVHPSIAYAKAHAGANIKTECWYILDAEPGSVIYKGVGPGVTRDVFERCLRDAAGSGGGVVEMLEAVPAIPGEMHNLPSGTVHALGAGVLVAEVQTPSDTTFRVYDWGRTGRELHVDAAMECISFGPARDATRLAETASTARLVSTGFFLVDEMRVGSTAVALGTACATDEAPMTDQHAVAIIVIGGSIEVAAQDRSFDTVQLNVGSTAVVPAALVPRCVLRSNESAKVLRATVMGK